MDVLASQRAQEMRTYPRRLLSSCKTVISLLSSYPPPSKFDGDIGTIESTGVIAAYALQEDYHEVLKQRLDQLADLIHELAGSEVETFACVDSAPILEKGYAQKAGLGWIGRNSLLLNPDFGSWTHLSELLISLELEPDLPFETDG